MRYKGCKRCVSISVEAVIGSVRVACPVCMERRSYIVSTEVFLGRPSRRDVIAFSKGGGGIPAKGLHRVLPLVNLPIPLRCICHESSVSQAAMN